MLDRQQLVYTLGASVVISGSDSFFATPRPRRQAAPSSPPTPGNAFSEAVLTLLSGSTSLSAFLPVD